MTKAEIINVIMEKIESSKADAGRALQAVEDAIVDALAGDGEARLGIGVVVVKESKARKGRNPATGETIDIPAKKRIKFRASKALKEQFLGKK